MQIDNDGEVIIAAGPSRLNDARLRRAQALASTNDVGLEIGGELLREKLDSQAKLLERLPTPTRAFFSIPELLKELPDNDLPMTSGAQRPRPPSFTGAHGQIFPLN
jgi:hypothetical protein